MNKKIIEEHIDEILNFIEKELRSTEIPIFAEIAKKIYEDLGIDIYPARVAQLCRAVNEEKGLNINFQTKKRILTPRKREYYEACKEADASGITGEEIYLCRLRGYSYSDMNRLYFELTGKLLSNEYFSEKFVSYCDEKQITQIRIIQKDPSVFDNITEQDLKNHSPFFQKMYSENRDRIRSSRTQKRNSTIKLLDPYKKLHKEMNGQNVLRIEHDDR
jgi:hypothetical protein